MAQATFPSTVKLPDFADTSNEVMHRVAKTQFGDGYTLRVKDGLNAQREEWSLSWRNMPVDEFTTLKNFLDAQEGYKAFYWTAPGGTLKLYTCEKYGYNPAFSGYWNFKATFREEFDLPE